MPRISIDINAATLLKVKAAAKLSKESVPEWIQNQIRQAIKNEYSSEFRNLFGSINDATFEVPERGISMNNMRREL